MRETLIGLATKPRWVLFELDALRDVRTVADDQFQV